MKIVLIDGLAFDRFGFPSLDGLVKCYTGNAICSDIEKIKDIRGLCVGSFNRTDPDIIELASRFNCFDISEIPDSITDYTIGSWSPQFNSQIIYENLYYVIDGKIHKYYKPITYKKYKEQSDEN